MRRRWERTCRYNSRGEKRRKEFKYRMHAHAHLEERRGSGHVGTAVGKGEKRVRRAYGYRLRSYACAFKRRGDETTREGAQELEGKMQAE